MTSFLKNFWARFTSIFYSELRNRSYVCIISNNFVLGRALKALERITNHNKSCGKMLYMIINKGF